MNSNEKISKISDIVSKYYEIDKELILSKNSRSDLVQLRSIILYLSRTKLDLTFREISGYLNKDISTLVRNYQMILNKISCNLSLKTDIKNLTKEIEDEFYV